MNKRNLDRHVSLSSNLPAPLVMIRLFTLGFLIRSNCFMLPPIYPLMARGYFYEVV